MGARVKEMNTEASVANTTVRPKAKKNWPMIPCMNAMGVNTTTLVRADAATAMATSVVPSSAAVFASAPRSRYR